MAEEVLQGSKAGKTVEANPELNEHFRFIGELAKAAARGDQSAGMMLDILNNQQLAEIQNLELELQVARIQEITRATLSFMPLPDSAKLK